MFISVKFPLTSAFYTRPNVARLNEKSRYKTSLPAIMKSRETSIYSNNQATRSLRVANKFPTTILLHLVSRLPSRSNGQSRSIKLSVDTGDNI